MILIHILHCCEFYVSVSAETAVHLIVNLNVFTILLWSRLCKNWEKRTVEKRYGQMWRRLRVYKTRTSTIAVQLTEYIRTLQTAVCRPTSCVDLCHCWVVEITAGNRFRWTLSFLASVSYQALMVDTHGLSIQSEQVAEIQRCCSLHGLFDLL